MNYIYGLHAVTAACEQHPEQIDELYVLHGRRDQRLQRVISLAKKHRIPVTRFDRHALNDLVENTQHQGVVARCQSTLQTNMPTSMKELLVELNEKQKPPFLLVLDQVQDPHNLGACLRTADAAGVDAVIASKDKAASITPVVRKVACGACESVPFIAVPNLARALIQLKEVGCWIYGACGEAKESLYQLDFSGPLVMVMGAEGTGLRELTRRQCDHFFHIPMRGHVSSLNVSVACGVSLFAAAHQRYSFSD